MRIGVDTGGTFTDCLVFDGAGVRVRKVFTDPRDPAGAILAGVRLLTGDVAAEPLDRKSTRLNSSHIQKSRMPSSA